MRDRRTFLQTLAAGSALPLAAVTDRQSSGESDRRYWLRVAQRIASPVLHHLASRQLRDYR